MCDCYTPAGEPIPTNKRANAAKIFSDPAVVAEETWLILLFVSIWIGIILLILLDSSNLNVILSPLTNQVWNWTRIHPPSKGRQMASWVASWWLPRSSGTNLCSCLADNVTFYIHLVVCFCKVPIHHSTFFLFRFKFLTACLWYIFFLLILFCMSWNELDTFDVSFSFSFLCF